MNRFLILLSLFVSVFLFANNVAVAQINEKTKHPIDIALDKCLEKNSNAVGMLGCIDKAYDQWDQELNTQYQKLSNGLNTDQKAKLRTAQLAWIRFRDTEFQNIESIYGAMNGTMYIPMAAYAKMEALQQRTLQLVDLNELLDLD